MKTLTYIIIGLIIYIPLFLFFYYKFKVKYSKLKTILLSIVMSYFITGLITVLLIILVTNYDSYFLNNTKFNSVEFKSNYKARLSMKNDFIDNKFLLNKTKPIIKNLLGEPSETVEGKWHYSLGSKGTLNPTFYILELSFNEDVCDKINIKEIQDN